MRTSSRPVRRSPQSGGRGDQDDTTGDTGQNRGSRESRPVAPRVSAVLLRTSLATRLCGPGRARDHPPTCGLQWLIDQSSVRCWARVRRHCSIAWMCGRSDSARGLDLLVHSESIPTAKRIVARRGGSNASPCNRWPTLRTTGMNDELRWRSCAATLPMQFDGDGNAASRPIHRAVHRGFGQLWCGADLCSLAPPHHDNRVKASSNREAAQAIASSTPEPCQASCTVRNAHTVIAWSLRIHGREHCDLRRPSR